MTPKTREISEKPSKIFVIWRIYSDIKIWRVKIFIKKIRPYFVVTYLPVFINDVTHVWHTVVNFGSNLRDVIYECPLFGTWLYSFFSFVITFIFSFLIAVSHLNIGSCKRHKQLYVFSLVKKYTSVPTSVLKCWSKSTGF